MREPGYIPSIVPEFEPPSGQDSATNSSTSAAPGGSTAAPGKGSQKGRSRLLAAALSFLWPGLGQLYGRRFITAAIFAVPVVVAAIWLVMQVLNGVLYVGLSFLDESFALTFVIGAAFLGIWRIVAMIHAYATTGPRRRPRALDSAVLAILLLVVVVVHATVVYSSLLAYNFDVDLANNVLVNNEPTAAPGSQPTATQVPTPVWQPGGSNTAPNPTPEVTPSTGPSHRVTILLTGLDWMPGRTTAMYDAIMLVSLDTETGKVTMISIPRDTADFDYYWGGSAGVNTKINNFATLVGRGLIHAPDPPLTAFANEVGYLVGVKVDYYAAIDMSGFGSMVNLLPGHDVCVYNPKAINDPSTGTFIASGTVCLNGPTAILYVRSRHNGGNDYVRGGRQQAVLLAAAHKIATPSGIAALPGLLSLGARLIQTNFPLNTVKNYVSVVQHLGTGDVTQCVLGPPYDYHPATALTKGAWTSRLKLSLVSSLSVYLFGSDSRYYGMEGVTPAPCAS
jgi:LCP family protein required for cell wall assembly